VKRTGNLASVMLESIDAAVTVIRSRAESLGIDVEFYKNFDIHFHLLCCFLAPLYPHYPQLRWGLEAGG
jgi:hypothetical protein